MNWTLEKLKSYVESLGFTVTSTTGGKHNKGSLHYQGRAIDVRTWDKTPAQIEWFMTRMRSLGVRVKDERVRPPGQKEWGGAHLHLSFGGAAAEAGEVAAPVASSGSYMPAKFELNSNQASIAKQPIPKEWRGLIVLSIALVVFAAVWANNLR